MTIRPFDPVVFSAIVFVLVYSQIMFARRGVSRRARVVWGTVGVLFLGVELWLAFSGETLSELWVLSIPLPWLIAGTWIGAVILTIHWIDLARAKKILARKAKPLVAGAKELYAFAVWFYRNC